jgi:DNA mismatch repair protein MutH
MSFINPPTSINELMTRARQLSGRTLGDLANQHAANMPDNLLIEKGWIGQFIEQLLGATAGSLPEPDFPQLGVELKTIPIDETGKPLESTYVSVVHLMNTHREQWHNSLVRKKLAKVLWFPIVSLKGVAIQQRMVATPVLWSPSPEQEAVLRCDWEDAMEKVMLGQLGQLNSRFGEALQIRPKAANASVLTEAIGPDGDIIKTLPRGFYLRSNFTRSILESLCY